MAWSDWFGLNPDKNPFLRPSEREQLSIGKKWLALFISVAVLFWLLRFFGG